MIRSLSLAALLVAASFPARANTVGVWDFNGVCLDCPGNGTGQLVVTQATVGGPVNFAFTYSSAWISYALTNATLFIDNSIVNAPTSFSIPTGVRWGIFQEVPITSYGGVGNPLPAGVHNNGTVTFQTFADLTWSTGSSAFLADFGNNGSWTVGSLNAVPEPSTAALVAGAMVALAWRAQRRRRGEGEIRVRVPVRGLRPARLEGGLGWLKGASSRDPGL